MQDESHSYVGTRTTAGRQRASLRWRQPAHQDSTMRLPSSAAFTLVMSLLLGVAGAARADVCFTVLDAGGRVLHQSRKAPVDMSRPISETLTRRFPAASLMVFGANNDNCQEMQAEAAPAVVTAPRRTRRM